MFAAKRCDMATSKRIRITNETLNCYGTWIRTAGVELKQFERNPVLLWMHQRGTVIGMIRDIRVEGDEITGEPYFDEVREESRLAKQQWDKGTLRMGSPNFEIIETSEDPALMKPGQTRPTVTRCRLVEYSMVDIGGNDDNIRLSFGGKELSHGSENSIPLLNRKTNQHHTNMNEQLKTVALMLGLAESATLHDVQQKINVVLEYQNANEKLKKERDELKKELETMKLSGITALVEDAVKTGKIDASRKEHFITLGKSVGTESLRLTFDAMRGSVKPTQVLNRPAGQTSGDWKKLSEVPTDELKLMRKEDPQQYRRLYKAEYGIDCPELD